MKVYLSVSEIVKVTGKQRTTIVRWVQAGKFGKIRKVGHEYQIPHGNFKQWWDRNARLTEPQVKKP